MGIWKSKTSRRHKNYSIIINYYLNCHRNQNRQFRVAIVVGSRGHIACPERNIRQNEAELLLRFQLLIVVFQKRLDLLSVVEQPIPLFFVKRDREST